MYNFYSDIRTAGKPFEEIYTRVAEDCGKVADVIGMDPNTAYALEEEDEQILQQIEGVPGGRESAF